MCAPGQNTAEATVEEPVFQFLVEQKPSGLVQGIAFADASQVEFILGRAITDGVGQVIKFELIDAGMRQAV